MLLKTNFSQYKSCDSCRLGKTTIQVIHEHQILMNLYILDGRMEQHKRTVDSHNTTTIINEEIKGKKGSFLF